MAKTWLYFLSLCLPIGVLAANSPPQASDDIATTAEDTPVTIDVLANDTDPDGDWIGIASVTDPGFGSVVVNEACGQDSYANRRAITIRASRVGVVPTRTVSAAAIHFFLIVNLSACSDSYSDTFLPRSIMTAHCDSGDRREVNE